MKFSFRALFALMMGAAITLSGGLAAQASPLTMQDRIDEVLVDYPGGTQTGPSEVTWGEGEIVLTLDDGMAKAVGTCATGSFCAYSAANRGGSKISFTNCKATNSVSPLGSAVRSVANARSSGNVIAYNGTTNALTVGAGGSTNTTAKITRLGC